MIDNNCPNIHIVNEVIKAFVGNLTEIQIKQLHLLLQRPQTIETLETHLEDKLKL